MTLRAQGLDSGGCQLTLYVSIDSGAMDSRVTEVVPEQFLGSDDSRVFEIGIAGDVGSIPQAGALSAVADCCGYEEGPACERHGAPTLYVTGPGAEDGSMALSGEKAVMDEWNDGADLEGVPGGAVMTRVVDVGGEGQEAPAANLSVQVGVIP